MSPHHLASGAGLAILRSGGNAIDAAIATNAALAVVAGDSCGLGGDAFWLVWPGGADARLVALNGSGRSATGATIEAARAAGLERMPARGPWTVTVPGAISSWGEAHERYGRLAWPALFEPALELVAGFPASPSWIDRIERSAAVFGVDGDWARTYRPHGRPWRAGERVVLAALGRTLRQIADDGPSVAYTGGLGRRSGEYLAASGSPLSADDLAAHTSDWGEPIETSYRGVTVTSHGPNSSGPIALELVAMLDALTPPPRDAFTFRGVTDAEWIHMGLEAARVTLADRDALLSDPETMGAGALATLLDRRRAARLVAGLDRGRVAPPAPSRVPAGGGTVYLATADDAGAVVSLIESNYAGFGSGLVDPETGIAFQNRGAFFSLDPAHANALAPRKRTMHTLTPGMLLRDGRPWIVHGAMGGEIQPQVFAQFVSAVVDGGLDVATAVTIPRWAAVADGDAGPRTTLIEPRVDASVVDGLRERGHDIRLAEPFDAALGYEHAIEIVRAPIEGAPGSESIAFAAATDPRSDGAPAMW